MAELYVSLGSDALGRRHTRKASDAEILSHPAVAAAMDVAIAQAREEGRKMEREAPDVQLMELAERAKPILFAWAHHGHVSPRAIGILQTLIEVADERHLPNPQPSDEDPT